MTEIKLTKRYPQSRAEDITDAFMRGYEQGKKDGLKVGKQIVLGAFETYINADRKTENSSEKPNNCEHITEDGVTCAKYPACDDCLDNPLNKVKGSERLLKGKDEPQTDKEIILDPSFAELSDEQFAEAMKLIEPQPDCSWK